MRDQATCSTLLTPDILAVIVGCITDSPANKLMSIRCLANMLQHGYGRGLIETCLANVLIGINSTKQGSGNLQVCVQIYIHGCAILYRKFLFFFLALFSDCYCNTFTEFDDNSNRLRRRDTVSTIGRDHFEFFVVD